MAWFKIINLLILFINTDVQSHCYNKMTKQIWSGLAAISAFLLVIL